MANNNNNISITKQYLLPQKGGFWLPLLILVLPSVAQLVSGLIWKKCSENAENVLGLSRANKMELNSRQTPS